jgi:hypothetical protein
VTCRVSPVSVRSAVTAQRASAVDQSARTMRWWNLMCSPTPVSRAVSRMYRRIDGPSAIDSRRFHGRSEYPRVNMSESERMPG